MGVCSSNYGMFISVFSLLPSPVSKYYVPQFHVLSQFLLTPLAASFTASSCDRLVAPDNDDFVGNQGQVRKRSLQLISGGYIVLSILPVFILQTIELSIYPGLIF